MHRLECIYSPFSALFFSSSSMDNNPCLVDRAWHNVQAQRLPGNRRGCTFGPNYPSQPPPSPSLHLHLDWFLLKEKRPQPLHPPTHPTSLSLSLPCCPQGWGCSLAMNVRLAVKPVLLKLGTSYNERHLRRTGKGRKVRGSLLYSAVLAYVLMMDKLATSVDGTLSERWKGCKRGKRCLKADESRWEWKQGS